MAQVDIHPEYHNIKVHLNDGTVFETKSVWGKEGDTFRTDVDPTNHPAWKVDGGNVVNTKNAQVAKFKKKYGNAF